MPASPSGAPIQDEANFPEEVARACETAFSDSLAASDSRSQPFPHRLLENTLPAAVVDGLRRLPFEAPDLGGVSGAREAHNDSRRYLDPALISASPLCAAVAHAFQSKRTAKAVSHALGADVSGCHLRIEYAQDVDGFWLAPHTDLGVKRFTLLCYLDPNDRPDLGTDLYEAPERWSSRADFRPGVALAFAPSDRTWHGFEPRPFGCVRKSLIVNYVTSEWRAREQLAFPDRQVGE